MFFALASQRRFELLQKAVAALSGGAIAYRCVYSSGKQNHASVLNHAKENKTPENKGENRNLRSGKNFFGHIF
jgi:hypothetical protein